MEKRFVVARRVIEQVEVSAATPADAEAKAGALPANAWERIEEETRVEPAP